MKKESKILLIGAVVILAILLAIPSGIIFPAATIVDQQCGQCNFSVSAYENTEWWAQSFAPEHSQLLQVNLRLGRQTNAVNGDLKVSIRSSLTGNDIVSDTMPLSSIFVSPWGGPCAPICYIPIGGGEVGADNGCTEVHTFDLPATLTPNAKYYIVIRRTQSQPPNTDANVWTGGGSVSAPGDYYKFGEYYYSSNSGSSWNTYTIENRDIWFQTIVSYEAPPTPQPPVAIFDYDPKDPEVNERVFLDGVNSYDPDGSIVNWLWDFTGDGTTDLSGVSSALIRYTAAGTFNAKLTVVDNDGLTSSTTKAITVSGALPPGEHTLTVNTQPTNCDVTIPGVGSKNSGSTGVATFPGLSDGSYQITVSKTGYIPSTKTIGILGADRTISFILESETITYILSITTNPILCTVTVNGETKSSGAEGLAIFTLSPGTYTIQVSKVGYNTRTETIDVTADTYFPITLTQSGITYALTITAISANDYTTPIPNAIVTIGTESKTTDTSGVAEFELNPGTYNIEITKPGFEDYTTSTSIVNIDKSISAFMIPSGVPAVPGFELIGVIVAIGVAFILLRRKHKK
jgi:hypothetical protein